VNIITQPTVKVIARSQYFDNENFLIPPDGTDIERLGAHAAKRCYRSSGRGGRPNVENQRAVLESKHGSVFQHAHVSLDIEGITRGLSLELNRHGLDISQESTRYVDIEKHGSIVLEPYFAELYERYAGSLRRTDEGLMTYLWDGSEREELLALVEHVNLQLGALRGYARQVERLMALNPLGLAGFDLRKWARGKARNVTPTGLATAGVWTGNMRMWRWVIELRSERHAEPEIRRLAGALYDALYPLAPSYFSDVTQVDHDRLREFVFQFSKV
jgi:thymidylate synthase (FAD)